MDNPDVQKAVWATAAAVIPALITLIGGLSRSDRRPRGHKRLLNLAELWSKLPDDSRARQTIGTLIDSQARALVDRESELKPINPANVALTTVMSLIFGFACYALVTWALTAGPWAGLAWTVAAIAIASTLLFVAAAIGTWRTPATKKVS